MNREKLSIKWWIILTILCYAAGFMTVVLLPGCNTISGLGADIHQAGEAGKRAVVRYAEHIDE